MKKVLVVMGSDSDLKVMEKCVDRLKSFDIPVEVRICLHHAPGHRRSDGDERDGRHGQPTFHRADAQGHPGRNGRDRRRGQRSHPRGADDRAVG